MPTVEDPGLDRLRVERGLYAISLGPHSHPGADEDGQAVEYGVFWSHQGFDLWVQAIRQGQGDSITSRSDFFRWALSVKVYCGGHRGVKS